MIKIKHFKYINSIILKLQKKFYYLDSEDIKNEANFILWECFKKHNPEKSSIETYLNRTFYYRLQNYCIKLTKENNKKMNNLQYYTPLKMKLTELTNEAREVVDLVYNIPDDFSGKLNKTNIRRYLSKKGWDWNYCSNIFNEIKECIS